MPKDFRKIPANRLRWYNGCDASSTLALYKWQRERMGPFQGTWEKLLNPALTALGHVERWGAVLSEENVRAYDAYLAGRIEKARAELAQFPEFPADLNPLSPSQIQAFLYETLKLPVINKTKAKNPSTDADTLRDLLKAHPDRPVLEPFIALKAAADMRKMYGLGQLKWVGYDGRVHPTFNMIRSGRLSCKAPNLQNLKTPDDDDEVEDDGKWAKGCYTAPSEDHLIVNLDYSQQELRVACMLSGDEVMAEQFASGVDFHTGTAVRMLGKTVAEVSKLDRRIAKICNFLVVFGGGADALAGMLKIGKPLAQDYIDSYYATFKRLGAYLQQCVRDARASGSSWAVWKPHGWAHRRMVTDVGLTGDTKYAKGLRGHCERVAMNNPIQNVANCFSLASIARAVSYVLDTGVPAEVNLPVHDSIAMYVRRSHWQEVAHEVRRLMLAYETGIVKLKVDAEVGERDLGHMRKVELD